MQVNANVTIVTTSTPVQFASRAEDRACKTTQLRITEDPLDSVTLIPIYSLVNLTYKTLIPPFTILKLQTYTLQTLIRAHHRSLHRCFPLPTIPVHLSPKPVLIHPHYLLLQFPLHPHCPIHPIPIGNPTSIHLLLLRKLHNQSDYFWTFLQGTAPLSCAATEANIDLFTLLILNLITLVTFSTMTILKTPSNWLTQALLGHSVCPPMSPLLFPPEEWWWTTPS